MTKRKFNSFVDIVTVLLVLFPLIMCVVTAIHNGTFDVTTVAEYVSQYEISNDLTVRIFDCVETFGVSFDGEFAYVPFMIIGNGLLIYLFRVFLSVLVFIPKMASKFINLDFGGKA